MKKIRGLRKVVLVGFGIIVVALMGVQMVSVSGAATRDENIQKIEGFLSNDAVNRGISEKGETYESGYA